MSVAIADARQTVAAPVRKPRKFGLFSVVDLVDGGEAHWILGGLQAEQAECSGVTTIPIVCGPSDEKDQTWGFDTVTGDPWAVYMAEVCKPFGHFADAAASVRQRFTAVEESGAEAGLIEHVLAGAGGPPVAVPTITQAIGALEAWAGADYGGQITLYVPYLGASEAQHQGMFERVGDHLETAAGNLVSIGNYGSTDPTQDITVYASGAVALYRSSLIQSEPQLDRTTNDYLALVERAYAGVIDCWAGAAAAPLCGC